MKLLLLAAIAFASASSTTAGGVPIRCYGELGCFWNGYPWSTIWRPVPMPAPREEVNATFYLFSASENDPIIVPTRPKISFKGTPFNASWKTIFITHGFGGDVLNDWPEEMARTIVSKSNYNVLGVYWSTSSDYLAALSNMRIAGAEISRVILYLIKEFDVSAEDVHLVGHSLGAHACSYAANGVGRVGRITGLDAAQPLFEMYHEKRLILDKTDARFVDAIHTDASPFIPYLGFGYIAPYGDVNFYVNGGDNQPGCSFQDILPENATFLDIINIPFSLYDILICSHKRSHEMYIDAIRHENCTMWGRQDFSTTSYIVALNEGSASIFTASSTECDLRSCSPMGIKSAKYPARGSFLVETNGEPPYCVPDPETDAKMALALEENKGLQTSRDLCAAKGIQLD